MRSNIIKFKPKGTGKKNLPAPQVAVKITSIRKKIHHV